MQEQKEITQKVEAKREARLKRLHELGRVNELIFTKEGAYEMDAYRRPLNQSSVRNNRRDMSKLKRAKKKRKRQFRIEKVCECWQMIGGKWSGAPQWGGDRDGRQEISFGPILHFQQ